MPTQITDREFQTAEGVDDWRVLFWGAKALFRTPDFATGVRFVDRIAAIAAEVGHSPQIDLRTDSVTVQVITIGVGLSDLDLELARRISVAAAEASLTADPSAVQHVSIAVDAVDREGVLGFWQAAMGYVRVGPDDILQPDLIGPTMWFQDKAHQAPRNRIHVDLSLPHDAAVARVDAILAAGGRMLGDKNAPAWWSLIDPEGNVVDVCTWEGRDEGSV
jgi:4a-hydroxytetrahydrobiopterin dehydratase